MPTPRRTPVAAAALLLALPSAGARAAGPPALEPPPAAAVSEARAIVEAMKKAERGPYQRIRWYCNDGTVHPAMPYPCEDKGGGHQHAEYSAARDRLAELGWHVGTLLTGTPWEELWDEGRRNDRLRELGLERYLIETDDGWVLHKARYYRGWSQIEDEEEAGRKALLQLLDKPDWVARNFLLARETVRTLPHASGGSDRTRRIRRLSKDIADLDPTFERIRQKIHTSPDGGDVAAVESWLKEARDRHTDKPVLDAAQTLVQNLKTIYGDEGRLERLGGYNKRIADPALREEMGALLDRLADAPSADRLTRLARVMRLARERATRSPDAASNLLLLDLSLDAEAKLVSAAYEIVRDDKATRRQLLEAARRLLDASFGAGLLSERERDALDQPLAALEGRAEVPTAEYVRAARGLERLGNWSLRAVLFTWAEPYARWRALDSKAAHFPDDVLRSSPALPAASIASRLARDAEERAGLPRIIFGKETETVAGLNPGTAVGKLRVLSEQELDAPLAPDEIVVLPRIVAELKPVAGILSLSEGNILSHVQILARNLGIPNATLSPALASALAAHGGETVLFSVGSDGSVVLERLDKVPEGARAQAAAMKASQPVIDTRLDAPAPDLSVRRPLPLAELNHELSGKVVGPKAANAGELARLFPEHVAPSIALPFGIYALHADAGPGSPKPRIDQAFARFRAGEIDEKALAAEVEAVADAVKKLTISPEVRQALLPMMAEQFGPPGTYGLFVRSDTNVEDLPTFTGAGLNLTLPNVVGLEPQLGAVAQVWASPFDARAIGWRRRVLNRPEEVYPSVLLMKSVDSEKSGVMVTKDLSGAGEGVTVAMAWGVGGAVDGEAAETVVLRPDGTTTLLSDAKAPYRRRLKKEGGIEWVPAEAGTVLTDAEQREVRALAEEARQRLKPEVGSDGVPLAWDMELGFAEGKLWLFQVRPLRERGKDATDRLLRSLSLTHGSAPASVGLDARPGETRLPSAAPAAAGTR